MFPARRPYEGHVGTLNRTRKMSSNEISRRLLSLGLGAGLLAPALGLPSAAPAQDQANGKEKDKEKPPDPVNLVVFGDSLADGLWGSYTRAYVRMRHVKVVRATQNSSGFTASAYEHELEKRMAAAKIDLMVMQVGANDRQRAFAPEGREWAVFQTPKWHEFYRQRIGRFLAVVQEKKLRAVWVGLPIMRKEDARADAKMMNGIYREMAESHGVPFVDIWAVTANAEGEYDAYREDEKGRKRRFRADDGIHFTEMGYDVVARHVSKRVHELYPSVLPEMKAEKTE
jgi:uncharacterized protein